MIMNEEKDYLVVIENSNIYYKKAEDNRNVDSPYYNIFMDADRIANRLGTECPYIAIMDNPISIRGDQDSSQFSAFTFHMEDYPDILDNSLVLFYPMPEKENDARIEYNTDNPIHYGDLVHEIRHIRQKKEGGFNISSYAESNKKSLFNFWEIDADAYAVVFVSDKFDMSIPNAAKRYLNDLYLKNKKAYDERLNSAIRLKRKLIPEE